MNRNLWSLLFLSVIILLTQCRAGRQIAADPQAEHEPMHGWRAGCAAGDTVRSFLISKAEAMMIYDNERYEVTLTLYSKKDSFLYLSAVSSGYEILRASANEDSIKVIDRINKVVYRTPLHRQFGYQFPVNFSDLQRISSSYYLCRDLQDADIWEQSRYELEFDLPRVKKRIVLKREVMQMELFEFYHHQTGKYLMGEKVGDGYKIYANLMIDYFEIVARGGTLEFNREVPIKMDVNPRKYTYIELQ